MKSRECLNINDFYRLYINDLDFLYNEEHLTDKSDDKVGHLNTILARGGGNLNDPIFKSSNARVCPG